MKIHLLKKSKILQTVYRQAAEQQAEVYLVGGALRDLLMGRPLGKDFDFAVRTRTDHLAQKLALETGGHAFVLDDQFGTWRLIIKEKGEKFEADLSPFQGSTIEEDLNKRDFTVNSLAISLKELFHDGNPQIVDPLQGWDDLEKRILRKNSEASFLQDPLRMLRAFRFSSTHNLRPDPGTLTAIQKNKSLIQRTAGERIRKEFFLALGQNQAGRFFGDLHRHGLLGEIFPETRGWETLDLEPPKGFTLLDHALKTVEACECLLNHLDYLCPSQGGSLRKYFSETVEEGISREGLIRFLAFFHDSGKPGAARAYSETQKVRFLDHDRQGEKINLRIGQRIKLSRKSIRILSELTRHHMRLSSLTKTEMITGRAKYRYFRDLGKSGIDLAILSLANSWGREEGSLADPFAVELKGEAERMKEAVSGIISYYFEEYESRPSRPLLDGNEVQRVLGILPGKKIGNVLGALKEAEISGKVRSREEALEFIKNIDIFKPII
ncbi:MAG: tRNA nucleotidyltransferase/poly(A) polymerase [Deltaproteobacteria bacterium]|nr:tRNA nucleotidyltransferase/poly(A) polymerase [Deltaproteobacteria bacterium]